MFFQTEKVIAGACLNKAPIFTNIYTNKSVAGLSISAIYGEVIMYSNSALYGLVTQAPFTAYGENLCVACQTIGLVLLIWHYSSASNTTTSKVATVGVYMVYVLLSVFVLPPRFYSLLIMCNWPALVFSRGSQIYQNMYDKHTGTQSIITHLMNLVGSLIRILTTMKEIGMDFALLAGYALSVMLNIILVTQCVFYRKNTLEVMSAETRKKKA